MLDREADVEAAERWVDDWQSGIEEQAARARALSARVAGLTSTASSDDGLVEVTVSSSGVLTGLRLDEAVRRRPAAETSAQILAVTRAALRRLSEQVAEAVRDTVGADSPAGRAVIDSYAQKLPADPQGGADERR
jgi:DNA-binding protein YbaB